MSTIEVRAPRAGDELAWRALWDRYCEFYETTVPAAVTSETWRRLLDPEEPVGGLVAEHGGSVVGFLNYVVHRRTWSVADVCYLEDLFVSEAARGGGAGRGLIEALLARARSSGWAKVYWHTHRDNARARALYDSFVAADEFVRYVVPTSQST